MGIYREWTDRQRTSNGELEVIGLWVMRQAALDRTHYAEVEAAHKRDIESMDDTLAYWKRQTLSAREEGNTLKTERDQANKWVSAYLLERNEAHEESERLQRRNDVQAETIDFLQKQNKTISDERDEARAKRDQWAKRSIEIAKERDTAYRNERNEARAEVAEAQAAHNAVVFELHHTRRERDSARAKVCELECKQAAREALAVPNRPTGRIEAIEARVSNLEAQSNAKLANEALDSLRFAR